MKSIKHELNGSDEMLTKSIEEWEATHQAHNTDQLTKAILSSVIFVAKHLLAQKALLLPWVSQIFLNVYTGDMNSVKVSLEVGDSTGDTKSQ